MPDVVPCDYDEDPERFRTARCVQRRHGLAADVHALVARRIVAEHATPVLDIGCGEGELARHLAEVWRVLRPGGLVAVAVPSRHDSPELAHALPQRALTCDAERAPGLVGERFTHVEIQPWDAPLLELPTRAAVRDYIVGKGGDRTGAHTVAAQATLPLTVTKRGALMFARRR